MTAFSNIPVKSIKLDPFNPRLPESVLGKDENTIVEWLYQNTNLLELVKSIAVNGYFGGEPIVVLPEEKEIYKVIEGNRRISAVKLLLGLLPEIDEDILLEVNSEVGEKRKVTDLIPCYIAENPESLGTYLAFKHVSGVEPWPVISKARYIYSLYKKSQASDPFKEIAKEIGSKATYVKRLLVSYEAYKLIKSNNSTKTYIPTQEEDFNLSKLSNAFLQSAVTKYININTDDLESLNENIDLSKLTLLVKWLYGSKDGKPIIRDTSRNWSNLSEILSKPDALTYFEKTDDFEGAIQIIKVSENNVHDYGLILKSIRAVVDDLRNKELLDSQDISFINEVETESISLSRIKREKYPAIPVR